MFQFLLATLAIIISFICLLPLTSQTFKDNEIPRAGVFATTLVWSTGITSLYMLVIGMIPGTWLRPIMVLPVPWLLLGFCIWTTKKIPDRIARSKNQLVFWLTIICIGGFAVISVNSVSYPFYRYDVLARFAPNAQILFESHSVPNTLTGYPLGVQMLYTFAFMAYGAINDHLAGMFVAAFSGAMLLTTFAIGKIAFSQRTAWAAVLMLLSSRLFVDWSTSGYVDIPVGVYHGLTFMCAFLWLQNGQRRWALFAGVMTGLAIWTKQSALVLIPALALVPLIRIQSHSNKHWEIKNGLFSVGTALLISGPWYLRSLLLEGTSGVLPAPGAYDAQFIDRSFISLMTFLNPSAGWGPWMGPATTLGIVLWATHFFKPDLDTTSATHINRRRRAWLLAAFIVPYHIIWWQGFSYQSRYLLASAPLYAVLAGHGTDWLLKQVPAHLRAHKWVILILACGMVFTGTANRMGAVYHLIVHPLHSDDIKLSRLSPDLWSLTKYIRATIEPGSTIYAMDGALAYWLREYDFRQGYPFMLKDLRDADYFITAASGESVYRFYNANDNEVSQALGDAKILPEIYRHNATVSVYHVGPLEP